MSPDAPSNPSAKDCFPRVSGDEPNMLVTPFREGEFSPRERG